MIFKYLRISTGFQCLASVCEMGQVCFPIARCTVYRENDKTAPHALASLNALPGPHPETGFKKSVKALLRPCSRWIVLLDV